MRPFVPEDFEPPPHLDVDGHHLEALGPQHNERDYAASTSSIEHILATPGYAGAAWPHEMTIDDNRRDLQRHADDFAARTGFTYTVLGPDGSTVVGCVYTYPSDEPDFDVRVRSWVRAQDAWLDPVLYAGVRDWLRDTWPFEHVDYVPRREP
jgi:hypothetical protein